MVAIVASTEQEGSENMEHDSKDVTGSDNHEQKDATLLTAIGNNGDNPHLSESEYPGARVGFDEEEEGEEGEEGEEENGKKEEETFINVNSLKKELSKIIVKTPQESQRKLEDFKPENFPLSYCKNNPTEKTVLEYAENFRCQYVHLYRDRKPLLLSPKNECGIPKFVCVTIRPTVLPFPELYEWDRAASFVADYLVCEMLEPPFELPNHILSPTTVMKRQQGNCFEYSTLLCSLLLGAGYDAYVVSGYATLAVCLADESREICPFLRKAKKEVLVLSCQASSVASFSRTSENLEETDSSQGTAQPGHVVREVVSQTLGTGLLFCGFESHLLIRMHF